MKINIAQSAGFCFGVKRAIAIAYKTVEQNKEINMLCDIVHNEVVVRKMRESGIKKIKTLMPVNDKILLISAHGTAKMVFDRAKDLGFKIVDATCPMVKQIHKIAADNERQGNKIIVIGDKKHDEVRGIVGQLKNKAIVIDKIDNIPLNIIKKINKAAVVVQSTQNFEKTIKIIDVLNRYIKELKFFNTICKPTRTKQEEIKTMPLKNDVMIIIGSKTSANTKRLYEISKSLNKRSYWVQTKSDIKPSWFKNAKNVGVTAGASTPDTTTKEVVEYIKTIT